MESPPVRIDAMLEADLPEVLAIEAAAFAPSEGAADPSTREAQLREELR